MKIMVSACLLGDNVKYNGGNNYNKELICFLKNYDIIKICPEVMGGLSIPRSPCEIVGDRVLNNLGEDKTKEYIKGASRVLEIVKKENIKIAILKEKSPSCGSKTIYDGKFSHSLTNGEGITARLLKENGVLVLNEENYKEYSW